MLEGCSSGRLMLEGCPSGRLMLEGAPSGRLKVIFLSGGVEVISQSLCKGESGVGSSFISLLD